MESKNGSADDEDEEDEDEDGEGEDEVDEDMDSEVSRAAGLVRAGHWQSCRGQFRFCNSIPIPMKAIPPQHANYFYNDAVFVCNNDSIIIFTLDNRP